LVHRALVGSYGSKVWHLITENSEARRHGESQKNSKLEKQKIYCFIVLLDLYFASLCIRACVFISQPDRRPPGSARARR
jgi:hypothetical protein